MHCQNFTAPLISPSVSCSCVCVCVQTKGTDRRDGGCSLSDGAETLEACIIDAVVNRGLQWPTVMGE